MGKKIKNSQNVQKRIYKTNSILEYILTPNQNLYKNKIKECTNVSKLLLKNIRLTQHNDHLGDHL